MYKGMWVRFADLNSFLAHLSWRLMGELIVYQSLWRLSSIRQHFQTSSPLKPLGQFNSNFIWRLLRTREQKFVQVVLVTWPRWPPRPYMVKTLRKSSPEPEGRWPWVLVCSIRVVGPTKFVQMMILQGRLTLTYLKSRSNLLPNAFKWENFSKVDFFENGGSLSHYSHLIAVGRGRPLI